MTKAPILILILGSSIMLQAQEKSISKQNDKQTKTESIEKSKIITFPIKSTKTTDPNYEINLKKSKETKANLAKEDVKIIKDDKYYIDKISELERRIKEIHENPNSPNVNVNKLNGLTEELEATKLEYIEFKKNK
jgi:hypothetical protein